MPYKWPYIGYSATWFDPPEAIYVTELWGPSNFKWEMRRLVNNPRKGYWRVEHETNNIKCCYYTDT